MLEIKSVLNLKQKFEFHKEFIFVDPEKIEKYTSNIFFKLINYFLPPSKKWLPQSFVAKENNNIIGQVILIPDSFSHFRWQFSNLKINKNIDFVARYLIDYAVNKYGGSGIATFLVYIDDSDTDALKIFKQECNFRSCSGIEFYCISDISSVNCEFNKIDFIDFTPNMLNTLFEINTDNIFTHFRPSLTINKNELKSEFLNSIQQHKLKIFAPKGNIEGYFNLYQANENEYYLDVITSKPYEQCYGEIVSYVCKDVLKSQKGIKLTVLVKKYRQTSGKLAENLKELGFKINSTTHILVKDYWKRVDTKQDLEEKMFMFLNDLKATKSLRINEDK